MYAIDIASASFEGKSIVKQHRLINDLLKEEIKEMHGLQVHCGQADIEYFIN